MEDFFVYNSKLCLVQYLSWYTWYIWKGTNQNRCKQLIIFQCFICTFLAIDNTFPQVYFPTRTTHKHKNETHYVKPVFLCLVYAKSHVITNSTWIHTTCTFMSIGNVINQGCLHVSTSCGINLSTSYIR